jgi:hypothetical protein
LSGQRQQLGNCGIRATDPSSGKDDLSEFHIGQHPVARDFLGRRGNTFRWRSIKHGLPNAPAQEGFERLRSFVGGARCAALNNS